MADLLKKLRKYSKKKIYPFHMPGHKRLFLHHYLGPLYAIDITEIEGFDDLHDPKGIILDSMRKASKLYQADETFFLINGSTAGILSAISGTVGQNDKIVIARNSHKSAYNAIFLRKADPVYIYPSYLKEVKIWGSVSACEVEKMLDANPECKAVFITSPTYEGIISDIKSIADVTHSRGVPLIVDEAHGAHLGLSKRFPESAVHLGADIVIQSIHKTLPFPTQTALLHINGNLVDRNKIKKYISMFQTSSPSYVLLAGIDEGLNFIEKNKSRLFKKLEDNLDIFLNQCNQLKYFKIFQKSMMTRDYIFEKDNSRIVVTWNEIEVTGSYIMKLLSENFGIQIEMAEVNYIIAIAGIMDTKEGFKRFYSALEEIEKLIEQEEKNIKKSSIKKVEFVINPPEIRFLPSEIEGKKIENILLEKAIDRVVADYIYLYPPGVPLVIPGEILSKELISHLVQYLESGFFLKGISQKGEYLVNVVKE